VPGNVEYIGPEEGLATGEDKDRPADFGDLID
jgi:hypothetical protein